MCIKALQAAQPGNQPLHQLFVRLCQTLFLREAAQSSDFLEQGEAVNRLAVDVVPLPELMAYLKRATMYLLIRALIRFDDKLRRYRGTVIADDHRMAPSGNRLIY